MTKRKAPSDETLIELYQRQRQSSQDIAERYGLTKKNVCLHLKRLGITRPESGPNSRNRNFKTKQYRSGYPVTFLPQHPRANHLGYVFDHILIIEKLTGKTPLKSEPIHHIDIDKKNVDPTNLYKCSSNAEHKRIHWDIEKIIKILLKRGEVVFVNGGYFLK